MCIHGRHTHYSGYDYACVHKNCLYYKNYSYLYYILQMHTAKQPEPPIPEVLSELVNIV